MMRLRLHWVAVLAAYGCTSTPATVPPAAALSSPPSLDVAMCGPDIGNVDALRHASLILLGEMHGMTSPPAFAMDLACRISAGGTPVQLAVELPVQEQGRIDAFLASAGLEADRAALLAGPFWLTPFQTGQSSEARVAMLDLARRLRAKGFPLRVTAIDDSTTEGNKRDSAMATAILAARRPGETTMLLIGNLHVRTRPGAPWDPKKVWTGVDLREKEPSLVSLDSRYQPGEAWTCSGPEPKDCGVHAFSGDGKTSAFGVELFGTPDEYGVDGAYDIGPAVVSRPAVKATAP